MTSPSAPIQLRKAPEKVISRAPSSPSIWRKAGAVLFILCFLAALVIPLATTDFLCIQKISGSEKRALKVFPGWPGEMKSWDALPRQFEEAFSDRFGFRDKLVRWYGCFRYYCLQTSPIPNAIVGKKGWLYLLGSTTFYTGSEKDKPQAVEKWVQNVKAKQAWFAARNIHYMLVVAPNKEDIYPEYLPRYVQKIRENRVLEEMIARVKDDPEIKILDLRKTLRDGKNLGLVYDRTDTHWSQLGAFLATNEILKQFHSWYPDLQPQSLQDRKTIRWWGNGGDLTIMMNLSDMLREKRTLFSDPLVFHEAEFKMDYRGEPYEPPMAFESNDPQKTRTLMIVGDSFSRGPMQFLAEHFRRTVRLRPTLPFTDDYLEKLTPIVDYVKPQIYLELICHRHLKLVPIQGKSESAASEKNKRAEIND